MMKKRAIVHLKKMFKRILKKLQITGWLSKLGSPPLVQSGCLEGAEATQATRNQLISGHPDVKRKQTSSSTPGSDFY